MDLDYKYNDPTDPNHFYERSDHYNFAKNGVPSVFIFNGVHADYHQKTDTPDKIEYDALTKRAQLAFTVAWELANRENRPVVDKIKTWPLLAFTIAKVTPVLSTAIETL
jgi:Zn-dependent M28 family amino/carboxypeptidase